MSFASTTSCSQYAVSGYKCCSRLQHQGVFLFIRQHLLSLLFEIIKKKMDPTFFLNQLRSPLFDRFFIPVTNSYPFLLATVPWRKIVLVMTTAVALKNIFKRKRPYDQNPLIKPFENIPDSSFPSGHTALAFCDASIRHSYLYAILMAVSRMYGGMHYFSDVAAGAFIGWQICKTSNPTG